MNVSPMKQRRAHNFKDISGMRFGSLVVMKFVGTYSIRHSHEAMWKCLCDCGKTTVASGKLMRNGNTRSCGCAIARKAAERLTTHGMSRSDEYIIWRNMKERCYNEKNTGYKNYGARGIKMCQEWENSFLSFYKDMGDRPSKKHSIERLDGDADYTKENCVWALPQQQARNKRTNHWLSLHNETLCLAEWCERTGLPEALIRKRLSRGWTVERALTTPKNPAGKYPSTDEVILIREMSKTHSQQYTADIFRISSTSVHRIIHGKRWANI